MTDTFKNIFGTKIEYKPFLQTSLNVWRIARYEDEKLDIVYENKAFQSKEECKKAISK